MKPLIKGLAVATLATAMSIPLAQAKELRMASGVPPVHPAHDPLYTDFQTRIAEMTDGRLSGSLLGMEIASIQNMRTAIKSQLVEVGLFLPAYFPADLPEFNLVGDMAFLGSNPMAMAAAMTEYVVTCGDCQDELKDLGIVYTSSHSTDVYQLLTNQPVQGVDDLQGLRLRVGGPQFSRWADEFGVSAASIPVGETFEALSQGVIEGTVASTSDIISFRLDDVIDYITTIELGTFHSLISHAVGLPTWQSLSAEDREAIARASTVSSLLTVQHWAYDMPAQAEEAAQQAGVEMLEPSQALLDATQAFVEKDLAVAARQAEERYDIANASDKLDRFRQLVEKWTAIAEEANEDPLKVAEALDREVWSQVDFTTYGI
ncbi:C4-dicarboxylate TRAP transporter substrate-binding protein [Halomonas cerina]|uniref:TRAP-type C4-dicarboxylate transport system substrate-binding protein n=1 Tax=Halomonas cerina TaxID=447424 RepID=A0A839VHT5_9GAMM|nr:C4-dicarboxylate TRAP transporter substrate-binding protein [Halomonas cerina]MBB3191956.1 TRAP-type C4-dicarboxylate transport system substrate-binding protein [Halomonas cerina]